MKMCSAVGIHNAKLSWERPDVPKKIYKKVKGFKKTSSGQEPVTFVIQEVPTERYEDALDYMIKNFITTEPMCRSINLPNDEAAQKEIRQFWQIMLDQGITIGAFVESHGAEKSEIAGLNVIGVVNEGDEKFMGLTQTPGIKKIMTAVKLLSVKSNIYNRYGIDKYLTAMGLSVKAEFQGQCLGVDLLRAREDICKAYGIPATLTMFTSTISQKQATRAGFEEIAEIDYVDLLDEEQRPLFPNIQWKTIKNMGIKYTEK